MCAGEQDWGAGVGGAGMGREGRVPGPRNGGAGVVEGEQVVEGED